jgi:16S rRNA pseudouridine516 synthase
MRLDKLISNSGFGTRKEVKKILKQGNIKVNNTTIKDGSYNVDELNDEIIINGETLEYKRYIYLMLNKPAGVVSSTKDSDETVIDIIPDKYKRYNLFPIGRLDKDTVGLLILSNDGQASHNLLKPKKHVSKTYFAKVKGVVCEEHIAAFNNGIILDDKYTCLPAELEIIKSGEISEVIIKIYEGKYHQIKRMFKSLNNEVIYLKRIKMGRLDLDESLREGECRELTKEEVHILLSND